MSFLIETFYRKHDVLFLRYSRGTEFNLKSIKATRKERGLESWSNSEKFAQEDYITYDIPWMRRITNLSFMRFIFDKKK